MKVNSMPIVQLTKKSTDVKCINIETVLASILLPINAF